ncbi:hypothetical protein M409DRAFT_61392 [Zasmidium cellare ATCC 36951]|uniref:ferric-chelate reductase (NADPH) n=1 Tax=Zasmidium cellare ATCC 36951 TaxID=1080233 RepID=A0A6A6BVA9_ZASCE|nr:uncharacterized protein M409DRAFT_61392 [Zasmidium cellare ATCC 36951]KAF2158734.1 hypothetical protein M409DRAFT_61392 [Zasmidium cellare ATCC 36951]
MALFNTYKVSNAREAASRAAYATVAHLLPLVCSGQLSFVSYSFGIPGSVGLSFHEAFGWMAAVQGAVHSIIKLQDKGDWTVLTKAGLVALCSLLALSCLPFARSLAYEIFLVTHQLLAITFALALWLHVQSLNNIVRRLCFIALLLFIATSCYRYARQVYGNLVPIREAMRLIQIEEVRKLDDSLILGLHFPRSWKIRPGQHLYLTVLTSRSGSILQRHPFTVTWWNASQEPRMYLMIRAQRGWTKSILDRPDLLKSRKVWLDGPYGMPICLENYGTVILFASGDGIFAQLPFLKAVTEACKLSRARTRRIKLVWLTYDFNEQVREWIQTILNDKDLYPGLLDLCVHEPNTQMSSKIKSRGRRVKIVHDIPNVRSYLQLELNHPETEIAVTGESRHNH